MRGLAAVPLLLMGCLVTEQIDFPEEPACPPSFESRGATNRIGDVILAESNGDGDAGTAELEFSVVIRDCNVSQALDVGIYLDNAPIAGLGGRLEGTGSLRREYDFTLPLSDLLAKGPGCYRLEARAAGRLNFFGEPEEPGDIGRASWWIEVPSASDPVLASECR